MELQSNQLTSDAGVVMMGNDSDRFVMFLVADLQEFFPARDFH
jgi:hypothetical protein